MNDADLDPTSNPDEQPDELLHGDFDDEPDDELIYAKYVADGADTLDEAAAAIDGYADHLLELHDDGWRLITDATGGPLPAEQTAEKSPVRTERPTPADSRAPTRQLDPDEAIGRGGSPVDTIEEVSWWLKGATELAVTADTTLVDLAATLITWAQQMRTAEADGFQLDDAVDTGYVTATRTR